LAILAGFSWDAIGKGTFNNHVMATINEKSLLEESYACIVVREDRIISATLKGFLKPEQATKALSVIFRAINELKLNLILINQKDLKVLSKETQDQIVANINELTPFLSRAAIIESEDIFAVAGLKAVQKNAHTHNSKIFTNENEAVEWLLQG
jgi:hypothetical protein